VDSTSTGGQAWLCEGVSAIVRDQEAIFLEELEPEVRVLDPRTEPDHGKGWHEVAV